MKILIFIFISFSIIPVKLIYSFDTWQVLPSDSLKQPSRSDSVAIIDTSQIDSSKIKPYKKKLFLIPKQNKLLTFNSFNLKKKNIDKLDYRYTGNLFAWFPFSHLFSLGSTGVPAETFFYGSGYDNYSLLVNGSSFNNKWKNSFDFYNIQTESIDNITLIPLTRGYLYNSMNNPVTLNITESDSFKTKPISRIRYLQAPGEGYIDAMFSAKVHPRVGISFRITNTSVDSGFANSSFDSWKANFKTIYKLTENIFTKLNYHHIKSNYGLNGGVEPESLFDLSEGLDNTLYNRTLATVNFYKRYNESTINRVDLNLFGKIFADNLSNFKIGYENTLEKFRQNSTRPSDDSTRISNDNQYSLIYTQLNQNFSIGNFSSVLQTRYEIVDYNIDYLNYNYQQSEYYIWLLANYHLLDSSIIPSVYGKILNYNNQNYNGFGFDIAFNKLSKINLFAGLSNFEKPYSLSEQLLLASNIRESKQIITTFFATANLTNSYTNTSISLFRIGTQNMPVPVFNTSNIKLNSAKIIYPMLANNVNQGVNINSKNKFGKFSYTLNLSFFLEPTNTNALSPPDLTLSTGIYYVDTLYSGNLDLKTGFTFYLSENFNNSKTKTNYRIYDFQQFTAANSFMLNNTLHPFDVPFVENSINQLDFFLSGRIHNTATFYFVFENILGNNFYNIPFYPMRERGVKIGLSWDFIN